jgi:hypothetical protein
LQKWQRRLTADGGLYFYRRERAKRSCEEWAGMESKFVILNPYLTVDRAIQKFLKVVWLKNAPYPTQEELIRQIKPATFTPDTLIYQ